MAQIPIISPDGTPGSIPEEQKNDALAQGYSVPGSTPLAEQNAQPATGPLSAEEMKTQPSELPQPTGEKTDEKTTLLNKETGKQEEFTTPQTQQLIASGSHDLFGASDQVPVKSPDGQLGYVPHAQLADALSEEGGYHLLSDHDSRVLQQEKVLEDQGVMGFGGGSVDAALAGAASPVYDLLSATKKAIAPSTKESQEIGDEARELYTGKHQTAYWIGKVPAEIATAIGTEGLAEAASGAAKLEGLTKLALKGAVYAAQPVAEKALEGDWKGAAEALATGPVFNIGLHYAGAGVGKLLEKPVLAEEDKLLTETAEQESQKKAENTVFQAIGVPPSKREGLRDSLQTALSLAEVTEKDTPKDIISKLQKLEESGPAIGKAMKMLDGAEGKESMIMDALQKASDQLREMIGSGIKNPELQAAEEELNRVTKNIDELKNKPFDPNKLLDIKLAESQLNGFVARQSELQKTITELLEKETKAPSQQQAEKALQPILDEIKAVSQKTNVNFSEDTQGLKRFVGDQTNWNDNKLANRVRQQAYGIVRDNLINAEDQAAAKVGGAQISQGLKADRGAWAMQRLFGDIVDRTESKQIMETPLSKLKDLHLQHFGIWGLLGHIILPGHGGGLIGVALSAGKTLLEHAQERKAFGQALNKILQTSESPATDLVMEAYKQQQEKMQKAASDFLKWVAKPMAAKAVSKNISDWLPSGGAGKSKEQQINDLKNMAIQYKSNPTMVSNHLGDLVSPLRKEGLEQVAQAYTDHQLRLMKVIDTVLPNDPSMLTAHPFAAEVKKQDISPAAEATYKRALTIASDPTHLLELIKNNQITQRDVAIAAATNPETLQKLRNALVEESIKNKPNLSYQQRLSMGILMGTNIDQSTQQVAALQSVYVPFSPPKQGGKKLGEGAKNSFSESSMTTSQKALKGTQ